MRPPLDPRCADAKKLLKRYARADALLSEDAASRLASVVDNQRDEAVSAHMLACARCSRHARTCASCGADLSAQGHAFSCAKNGRRWLALFAPSEPPLAHLAPSHPRAPPPAARASRKSAPRKPAAAPPPTPSAWEILGVERGAGAAELRAAYLRQAKAYHPDRFAHLGGDFRALAETRMRDVNAAYQALRALPSDSV